MKRSETGTYNYLSLNIRKIRRVNPSRGAREGNNALTKDMDEVTNDSGHEVKYWGGYVDSRVSGAVSNNHVASLAMKWGVPFHITQELANSLEVCTKSDLSMAAIHAVRYGHAGLAAKYMDQTWDPEYNHYHAESLAPFSTVEKKWGKLVLREASAKKKGNEALFLTLFRGCFGPVPRAFGWNFWEESIDQKKSVSIQWISICFSLTEQ